MAQFHAYRITDDRLVLDLQSDLIETGTRVVAPLIPLSQGPTPLAKLEPIFQIGEIAYVLHTAELAAVPSGVLKGQPLADLTRHDYQIRRALDMVFLGF